MRIGLLLLFFAFVILPVESFGQNLNQQKNPKNKNLLTAKIVSTKVVIRRGDTRSSTDLTAFKDQLFLTFLDRWTSGSSESCIRVLSSKDGSAWNTVATIRQQDRDRYLVRRHPGEFRGLRLDDTPRLSVEAENRLSIRAVDAKFGSTEFETRRMSGWSSSNGADWNYEGALDKVLQWGEIAWNRSKGFAFGYGGPCGEAVAMEILKTTDGKKFHEIYEHWQFGGSNPERAALFFDDTNRIFCLMPTYGGGGSASNNVKKGDYNFAFLGTAESPYKKWSWTKTNQTIWSPRVVSVPKIGFVAVVEIRSEPIRTSLCHLEIESGKLTELVSFGDIRRHQLGIDNHEPLGAEDLPIGLAEHEGNVWVSYNRGPDVFVAKIAFQKVAHASLSRTLSALNGQSKRFERKSLNQIDSMKCILTILMTSLTMVGLPQMALSQQPISKGTWDYKNGKPESVTFDYGTKLTAKDIDQLSSHTSLSRIVMGYAGVDSEYVTIEGDLLKLGRLKNLEEVHLCKDGINNDDLKFIALLPKIHTLEFNADNGNDGAPICTDQCADHLSSAKTLRRLLIHDGRFTDKFVAKITRGLPDLEELSLNSSQLTDESLQLLGDRCKKLKSLSIASDHFTAEGLKHLDKLKDLKNRAISSQALRQRNDPKDILKLLGTWEYVSATYDGKPMDIGKNETITLSKNSWTLRRNGKLISNSTWEIDSTRSPKWLTQFTQGGKVNFLDRWVYKFNDHQLVICKSSWVDGRRPQEFVSRKGDKQYLIILRRTDTNGKNE